MCKELVAGFIKTNLGLDSRNNRVSQKGPQMAQLPSEQGGSPPCSSVCQRASEGSFEGQELLSPCLPQLGKQHAWEWVFLWASEVMMWNTRLAAEEEFCHLIHIIAGFSFLPLVCSP